MLILADRLIGSPLCRDDWNDLLILHRAPDAMATLGGVHSEEKAEQWFRDNLSHWERYGFGIWIFRDCVDMRFAGRGGLRHVRIENEDEIELAYALLPAFWGRGLATEMAHTLISCAGTRFGLTDLVGFTLTTNLPSRRVLEKVGFRYEHDFLRPAGLHALYRMDLSRQGEIGGISGREGASPPPWCAPQSVARFA